MLNYLETPNLKMLNRLTKLIMVANLGGPVSLVLESRRVTELTNLIS